MEAVIDSGINHIDVAPPTAGRATPGPGCKRERERFFVGCKTMERTCAGARNELHESLKAPAIAILLIYINCTLSPVLTSWRRLPLPVGAGSPHGGQTGRPDPAHRGYRAWRGCPGIYLEALRRSTLTRSRSH